MAVRSGARIVPLTLVLMLLALAGGVRGSAAQDKVTLLVWDQFTGPETEIVDDIYAKFTEANPNIEIKRESYQTQQMQQTANTAISSGTGPDVIFYDSGPGYAGVLASAGLLLPLDDYAAQYGWKERIAAQSLEAATLDGKLYGLPLQVDLIGMYINQAVLDENDWTVPTTLDELIAFCGQAKDKGLTPFAFSDNPGWQAFHQFSMTANAMIGPDAMRSLLVDHQGRWDSPEIVTAIKSFFVDLKDAGCFSEDANALEYNDGNSLFYTGEAPLNPTGSWLIGNITENMPDANVGFVPFPTLPGSMGQYWISGVGSSFYISAKSEHPNEAAHFLDYLFSPDVAKRWVGEAKFNVPMQVDTTGLEITPLQQLVLDVLAKAANGELQFGYNVDVLAPPAFNDAMQNGFQAIISGDKTPEQVAGELQAAWETTYPATPAA